MKILVTCLVSTGLWSSVLETFSIAELWIDKEEYSAAILFLKPNPHLSLQVMARPQLS